MKRLGIVVGGIDHFVRPLELAWQKQYICQRFVPHFVRLPLIGQRVNSWLLRSELQQFIHRNDVTFFEWASNLLIEATKGPVTQPIVARLHSGELAIAQQVQWQKVHTTIVVSNQQGRRFQQSAKPQTRVVVIPYGVDLDAFRPQMTSFAYRLCMVCRLVPIKRVYEVIIALHTLRNKGYPYTLHLLGAVNHQTEGEGALYPLAVHELIDKLGLGNAVFQYAPRPDVWNWLPSMDVFISNSYWEGLQVALLEAMACGCYCLSHQWGGAEEALPLRSLFLSEADLVDKLVTYADLPPQDKLHERLALRSIAEATFGLQPYIDAVDKVIQDASQGSHA